MYKYIVGINGMGCGACEAHVQDKIRRHVNAKMIKASHAKNNLIVISEEQLSEKNFHDILDPTGYIVTSFEVHPTSKTLFGWR